VFELLINIYDIISTYEKVRACMYYLCCMMGFELLYIPVNTSWWSRRVSYIMLTYAIMITENTWTANKFVTFVGILV